MVILMDYIKLLIKRIIRNNVFSMSAEVSYFSIMSFFPFLIFLVSLISILSINSINVLYGIAGFLPSATRKIVLDNINLIYSASSPSVLSFGLIISLIFASNGVNTMTRALNRAYDIQEHRGFIKLQLIAVTYTIIISILSILFFMMFVYWQYLEGKYLEFGIIKTFSFILQIIALVSIMFFSLTLVYKFMIAQRLKWKHTIWGAAFATLSLLAGFWLFTYYSENLWGYSRIYGTIGSVIVLLVWLYISASIIIIGGEINALIIEGRSKKTAKLSIFRKINK